MSILTGRLTRNFTQKSLPSSTLNSALNATKMRPFGWVFCPDLGAALCLILGAISALATPTFAIDFPSQVAREEKSPPSLTNAQLQSLESYQYIFVDGTLGEVWGSNFAPASKVLIQQWPGSDMLIIRPHTPNSIPQNADILFQQISEIRKTSHKDKAVIIAHSKGATEVLLMALQHPELSTELGIAAYGLIAGPFAGTDVIDYVEKACSTPSWTCNYLNRALPALQTFTPSVILPIYKEALLKLSDANRKILEPQIFYVRLQMPDSEYLSTLYPTHLYLSMAHPEEGPNDGLIPTENERLFEVDPSGSWTKNIFGTDLGVIVGDHNSVTNRAYTKSALNYREAFFRAFVERMMFGETPEKMKLNL